jgi:hypothetical protein
MTHPKLREAVARAIDPEAYDNDEYTQIKARRRVYAEAAADRILSLPEIADALKREEDQPSQPKPTPVIL